MYRRIKDYQELKELGSGAFGTVMLVQRVDKEQERGKEEFFALKKVPKKSLLENKRFDNFFAEKEILRSLKHERIVRLVATFQDTETLYYVLEYLPNGNFEELFKATSEFRRIHG